MKRLVAAAAFALVAGPALAQQTTMVEVADETMVAGLNMEADDVDDLDVYASNGIEIGDVEEVVGPDRDTAEGLVVDFDDSAYGEEDRIVPIDQFSMSDDRVVINADAAAISAMPTWDD